MMGKDPTVVVQLSGDLAPVQVPPCGCLLGPHEQPVPCCPGRIQPPVLGSPYSMSSMSGMAQLCHSHHRDPARDSDS